MANEDILDLDSLVPQPQKVKFNDEIITVNPPKIGDILLMGKLGREIQEADPNSTDYEPVLEQIKTVIANVAPGLAGKELTIEQILALVELLGKMARPDSSLSGTSEADTEKKAPSSTAAQ